MSATFVVYPPQNITSLVALFCQAGLKRALITFIVLDQNPSPGYFLFRSDRIWLFFPPAFEVLERNLLVSSGPQEHDVCFRTEIGGVQLVQERHGTQAASDWRLSGNRRQQGAG